MILWGVGLAQVGKLALLGVAGELCPTGGGLMPKCYVDAHGGVLVTFWGSWGPKSYGVACGV